MPDEPVTDPVDDNEPEGVRNLREALRRSQEQADAGLAAMRELAFVKAGIATDTGPGKLLFDAYAGELTADAVRAEAAKYGLTPAEEPEPPAPPEPGSVNDPSQTEARRLLTGDSLDPGTPPREEDPIKRGYAMFHEDMRDGATAAEASGAVLGAIFEGARNGDERFIYDAEAWRNSEAAKSR
jgi:hypothetical protein